MTVNSLREKESELPRLTVTVKGEKLSALVDSGSAATLLSAAVWERIGSGLHLSTGGGISLRSVTGETLPNVGCTELPITIGESTVTQRTCVIEGLPYDLLLGIDYIRSSRMVLNAAEGHVQLGNSRVPFASSCGLYNGPRAVSLAERVTVPAQHVCAVAVRIDAVGPGQAERLVEFTPASPEGLPSPFLEVSGVIAQTSKSGLIMVPVVNPSDTEVILPAGYVIGQSQLFEGLVAAVHVSNENAGESDEGTPNWAGRWPSRQTYLQQFPLDHLTGETRTRVEKLLCKYQSIFSSHDYDLGRIELAAHTIRLKPGADPVHSRPYPCSEHQRRELWRQLEEMLRHDLIEPAYDGYTSPCILVKKPHINSESDTWRLCQSFVKLNSITETLSYPLPNMQRILEELGRHRGFVSSMDMTKSFYQIRVQPDCAKLAGFITPFGIYAPKVLLMGLKNSSASLQRVVDAVYAPLLATGRVHCYLDDLICSTSTEAEHLETLEAVFQQAQRHDVKYKPSKTKLLCRSVKLLGHVISPEGISVDDTKTRAVSQIAEPTNKTEVRAFVGLANFYKRFVRGFATLARPLLNLLKKNAPFTFTDECRESFEALKRCLCESPVLRYPDFSGKYPFYPFHVYTDASSRALGAALHQEFEDGSHPIAYASRVLTPSEIPQPILVKESLAVVFAICEKFFYYLDGRHFILTTDNSALRYLLQATREPKGSSRLVRDALRLLDFDFEVRHRPGPEIPHVDGLSRLSWREMREEPATADIDLDARTRPICAAVEVGMKTLTEAELREEQLKDERLEPIIRYLEGPTSDKGPKRYSDYSLSDQGILQKQVRSQRVLRVVPESLQEGLIRDYHEGMFGGHIGWAKMLARLRLTFVWTSMREQVMRHVQRCASCEGRSAGFLGKAPIQDNYQASHPFQKVSIDLLTGLPVTDRGNAVMLTAVDCFTRWVELIPLPSRTAKEVALALRDRLFLRHGVCDIVSDNGAELVSEIIKELYSLLGVKASTCTTYHPQAQGKVERTHRVIADMLAKYISSGEPHWDLYAASCQFAMNNSVHSATGHTPYYLVHGRAARVPAEAVIGGNKTPWHDYHEYVEQLLRGTERAFAEVRQNVQKAHKANQVRMADKARLRTLNVGDAVLLHDPHTKPGEKGKLASRWKSGYKVIDKFGTVNYYIEHERTQKRQLVHIDRLKLRRSRADGTTGRPHSSGARPGPVQVGAEANSGPDYPHSPPPSAPWGGASGPAARAAARDEGRRVGLHATRPRDGPERAAGAAGEPRAGGEPASRGVSEPDTHRVRTAADDPVTPRASGHRGPSGAADRLGRAAAPGPSRTDSTTPEPASDSDSDSGSEPLRSAVESGSASDEEDDPEHLYAQVEAPGRYPGRERRPPDRYTP